MKKVLVGVVVVIGLGAVVVAGVASLRPDLVPGWARIGAAHGGAKEYGLYCEEHGVPEKFCTLCHPELKDKLLLCPEHGDIPEDICTLCHPDVEKKNDIEMCPKGHGLPKNFCSKCDAEAGKPAASSNLIDDGYCTAFGRETREGKTVCQLLPVVRLASAGLASDVGITTSPVIEDEHAHELVAPAETAYDANRYAEIFPRVAGFLREARVDLGQEVKAVDVIAVIDSSEVSTTKSQYLTAHATLQLDEDSYKRTKHLSDEQILGSKPLVAARIAMHQARTSLLNAEQKLRNFRFDDAALALILKTNDTRPLLDITTPIDGTVVLRHAVTGEAEEPTSKLYAVADVSKLWLWVDIFERDIRQVRPGQAVTFTVSGTASASGEVTYPGRVTWVGTEVDEKTRTTKVRAELPNRDGLLRAHQFGRARIRIGEPHKALLISKSAVQRYENADMVFLKQKEGVYRPQRIRTVSLGRADAVEVSWGLKPGEEVVTTGAFLLKTEIMKGSIGAGCCD
jgi:membrane fusion protein, heavy metal efflux system